MALIVLGIIAIIIGILGSKEGGPIAKFKLLFVGGGIIVAFIGLISAALVQVNSGQVGVKVLFGDVQQESVLYEGLNFVNPLIQVQEMSIKTRNYTMSSTTSEGEKMGDDAIKVLSKDGLEVVIDLTILYRMIPIKAPEIYRNIGIDYEVKIIRPMTRTQIRENAVDYNAIELYSTKRQNFEIAIRKNLAEDFKKRGIMLEKLLIRNINLPASVKQSIERKLTAEQEAQRMQYVLQKEKQEAERKRVEAKGTRDAQRILNAGLTDRVLRYEAIKVQKQLVDSKNSKIILLGSGKGTPPFIIGK